MPLHLVQQLPLQPRVEQIHRAGLTAGDAPALTTVVLLLLRPHPFCPVDHQAPEQPRRQIRNVDVAGGHAVHPPVEPVLAVGVLPVHHGMEQLPTGLFVQEIEAARRAGVGDREAVELLGPLLRHPEQHPFPAGPTADAGGAGGRSVAGLRNTNSKSAVALSATVPSGSVVSPSKSSQQRRPLASPVIRLVPVNLRSRLR